MSCLPSILRINALPLWVGAPLTESQERRHDVFRSRRFFLAVAVLFVVIKQWARSLTLHVGQPDYGTIQGSSTTQQQARKFFLC